MNLLQGIWDVRELKYFLCLDGDFWNISDIAK